MTLGVFMVVKLEQNCDTTEKSKVEKTWQNWNKSAVLLQFHEATPEVQLAENWNKTGLHPVL
jgi:hypothetical protein